MKSMALMREKAAGLVLLIILMLLGGCEKLLDNNPEALFLCQYINHAWGYRNSGYLIDREGNVRLFELPEKWNYPNESGYLTVDEMNENLQQTVETSCIVRKGDMAYFASKLRAALSGKTSEREHTACDMGSTSYGGYIYEPEKNMYKYVFIRQTGDFSCENMSREADVIYEWMQDPCRGSLNIRLR